MKLTVNPFIGVGLHEDESIEVWMFSNRQRIILEHDPVLEWLLIHGDELPSSDWVSTVVNKFGVSSTEFLRGLDSLIKLGIVIEAMPIDSDGPFVRQDAFFFGQGLDGSEVRKSLSKKKILIFGCGGIGGSLVEQLVAMGAEALVLVDDDEVEMSNQNRSAVYSRENVGLPKVDVLAEWVRRKNPRVRVVPHKARTTGPGDIVNIVKHTS